MKADKLAAKLETLGPGLWEHIDHAATDDPEMRASAMGDMSGSRRTAVPCSRRGPAPRCGK